ncbi:hypothetical protein [Catenovulum maritimum]|uniref:Transmembrane protein n=1 Tax=Catenovulum maritimum TaxID=1513271 RepID=A0A0J8JNX7_9ALTE|nr:hypothetical protein [Catenovulum maritimum]KMT66341.1 hypothetical protein XM47_03655 [Catenovulum maritimum]
MIKTRYLLLGLGLLFATLTFLSFYFYWQENKGILEEITLQAEADAVKFAQTHDQNDCLTKVIEQSNDCRDSNCTVGLKQFFYTCFKNAKLSDQVCYKVPETSDYMAKVSWATSTCRKAKVKNGVCNNIINELPLLCHQKSS